MTSFAILACVSLLLFLTGTVQTKPIVVRSTKERLVEQPDRCRSSKPRTTSTSSCETTKTRRFFFHETNPKGCKPFGLCETESVVLDGRFAAGTENYFSDYDSCQRECMTHIQCPALSLSPESNARVVSNNDVSGWGEKVVYECLEGYGFSNNEERYSRVCQKNKTWSGEEPKCHKKCPPPEVISNGNFAPSKNLYNYGGNIRYFCSVGYNLVGNASRTCGENGQWSEPEPQCTCASLVDGKCSSLCAEPSLIPNGDIDAPEEARVHGGISHYSCRNEYILMGNSSRTCYNGSWLEEEPICWRVLISMVSTNTTKDVTNSSVTLVKGSKDVVFRAIPTHKSLFSEAEVQWYFVGKNDRTVIPVGVMVGLDKLSLTFNTILNTEEQEGNYTITFGDYSTSFMLDVVDPPSTPVEPPRFFGGFFGGNSIPVREVAFGSRLSLLCASDGVPLPTITWSHNGSSITVNPNSNKYSVMNDNFSGTTFSKLTIKNIQESDLGEYGCASTNLAGSKSIVISHLIRSSRKKRSAEPSPSASICPPKSSNTVTFQGRMKRMSKSGQLLAYKVHLKQVFTSASPSKSTRALSKSKTISVVVLPDAPLLDYREEMFQPRTDYVLQGELINGQFMLASQTSIHRYTEALRQQLAAC